MTADSLFPADPNPVLPILPLRNSVLFPASVVPVNVGRPRSVRLIEEVVDGDEARPLIGVVAQIKPQTEDPDFSQVHKMGTIARVLKVIRLSSGNYSVVLQGVARMRILDGGEKRPVMRAKIERIRETPNVGDAEIDAFATQLRESARSLFAAIPGQPRDADAVLDNVREPGALADIIASNLPVGNDAKQKILETLVTRDRLLAVRDLVQRQDEVYRVKTEISTMVEEEMSKSQRQYLLRQQMKAIKRELGEPEDDDEVEELRDKIAEADMPTEAERAARKQLSRMRSMNSASSEYHVTRNYVEWLTDLPWTKLTPDRLDVGEARRVLDEDHHGLADPKRRILEYIAVRRLRHDVRGPILCFVGPPGVGKTSLARSISRATGRHFERVALGGVRDEAEVRGHRRTYVGSFPGRIIAAMKNAGSRNPVILLDEIDKLAKDGRGDPASALLEVLDPAQNSTFADHYLEVPFDLSQVMFIATANRKDTIPRPLLDRMEVIEIAGYTREEKFHIARSFLIPRQLEGHGLSPERLDITDEGVQTLVDDYTREAGVRRLEQQVSAVCRSVAVRLANGEDVHLEAGADDIQEILGPPRYRRDPLDRTAQAGVSAGLAWTPAGGDVMYIEARQMPGQGMTKVTGQLGGVMQESVAAAFTYVRANADTFGLPADFLTKIDVHVHLPGAMPKDGPSAGIPITVAIASMLTRLRVRADVAMTGEITLRGNILGVGGIKEKCLAAHRAGLKRVILPKRNEADLEQVPEHVREQLDLRLVSKIDEVLPLVFDHLEQPVTTL